MKTLLVEFNTVIRLRASAERHWNDRRSGRVLSCFYSAFSKLKIFQTSVLEPKNFPKV